MPDAIDWPSVRRSVLKFLKSRGNFSFSWADDIAQETMIRMFIALKEGEDIQNPVAWGKRVAWRLMHNKHRDEPVHISLPEHDHDKNFTAEQFVDGRDPETLFIQNETLRLNTHLIPPRELGDDQNMSANQRKELQRFRAKERKVG